MSEETQPEKERCQLLVAFIGGGNLKVPMFTEDAIKSIKDFSDGKMSNSFFMDDNLQFAIIGQIIAGMLILPAPAEEKAGTQPIESRPKPING